jgi:hypothetical protein
VLRFFWVRDWRVIRSVERAAAETTGCFLELQINRDLPRDATWRGRPSAPKNRHVGMLFQKLRKTRLSFPAAHHASHGYDQPLHF